MVKKLKNIKTTTIWFWLKKHKINRRGFTGHKNQIEAAHKRKGKFSAWNKGTKGKMPIPWNKGKGNGFYIDKSGYKWVRNNEYKMFNKCGFVAEHRLIMSRILKRTLKRNELVHHKNKNRQDNRPKNLILIKIGEPNAHKVCCPNCNFNWLIK